MSFILRPKPRRTALAIIAVLLVGLVAMLTWPSQVQDARVMTVAQAHDAVQAGEILLIDIREPDEWRQTGLAAEAVPLDMRREDFTTRLTELTGGDKAAPVALICATGGRSAWLARRLTSAGFTNVIDVSEGMIGSGAGPGWLRSGLPVRRYEEG